MSKPKRTAYVNVEGHDGATTTMTYDVTEAPNEALTDVVSLGLNAHEKAHYGVSRAVHVSASFDEEVSP